MTYTELLRTVADASQVPEPVVRQVLDGFISVLRASAREQVKVSLPRYASITPRLRDISVISNATKTRSRVKRLVLTIRPVQSFREDLRQWTNTLSSPTTNFSTKN